MNVQLPKRRNFTMPSVESFHILRDPPKSIHTRKKERVDFSDVSYMVRNDSSRINEGISYLQRGVNNMVDISYNNTAGGSKLMTMPQIQASNPYKVETVRPPMFRQEDLLPLSRLRRPETSAITNPGIRSGFNIHNLETQIDNADVNNAIDKAKINYLGPRPTGVFRMEIPQEVFSGHRMNNPLHISATTNISLNKNDNIAREIQTTNPLEASRNSLNISATSNVNNPNADIERSDNIDYENYIKDNPILENIGSNFRIMVYDSSNKNYSEVFSSIKDRLNIAVTASLNNPITLTQKNAENPIRLKNYRWKIVNSNVGAPNLVLIPTDSENLKLERNVPLYAAGTNVSGNTKVERFHSSDPIMREQINTSANSSISMKTGRRETIHDNDQTVRLRGMGSIGHLTRNTGYIPTVQNHDIPNLDDNKNMSIKQIAAREQGNRFETY